MRRRLIMASLLGLLTPAMSMSYEVQEPLREPSSQDCPADLAGLSRGRGELHYEALCSNCHGREGEGSAWAPGLRNNLGNPRSILRSITNGAGEMPPVATNLEPTDLVELVNFLRNSWGNSYGCIQIDEVISATQ